MLIDENVTFVIVERSNVNGFELSFIYCLCVSKLEKKLKLGKLSQNPKQKYIPTPTHESRLVSPDKYCSIRYPHSVVSILVCHRASCALLALLTPAPCAGSRYVVETDGLLIKAVQKTDGGTYTCRARVPHTGELEERDIQLDVGTRAVPGHVSRVCAGAGAAQLDHQALRRGGRGDGQGGVQVPGPRCAATSLLLGGQRRAGREPKTR